MADRSRDDIIAALTRVTAIDPSLIGDTIDLLTADLKQLDQLRELCAEMAEAIHVYASMTRVPITTKPHYTAHALMALERWNDLDG